MSGRESPVCDSNRLLMSRAEMIRSFLCCIVVLVVAVSALAQDSSLESDIEQQIWALEDAYWQYAAAGDVDSYLALWHEDFVGWFCGAANPTRKSGIGDWVQAIRDLNQTLVYQIDNKTIQEFDNLVIVYYTTPVEIISRDGTRRWAGVTFKVTHTWLRTHDEWLIIGGMCGALGESI